VSTILTGLLWVPITMVIFTNSDTAGIVAQVRVSRLSYIAFIEPSRSELIFANRACSRKRSSATFACMAGVGLRDKVPVIAAIAA
jgi:hypothetical protein